MDHNDFDPTKLTQAHRVMGAVVGFVFAAIGVLVIGWLWLQPFGDMNPPLFFRLFGSLIAIVFVAVGGTMGITALKGGASLLEAMKCHAEKVSRGEGSTGERATAGRPTGYKCSNCGATLGDNADVSPAGDVKCDYCRTWFNIHA